MSPIFVKDTGNHPGPEVKKSLDDGSCNELFNAGWEVGELAVRHRLPKMPQIEVAYSITSDDSKGHVAYRVTGASCLQLLQSFLVQGIGNKDLLPPLRFGLKEDRHATTRLPGWQDVADADDIEVTFRPHSSQPFRPCGAECQTGLDPFVLNLEQNPPMENVRLLRHFLNIAAEHDAGMVPCMTRRL